MVNSIRQALTLVILMLLSPWASADISSWQGPSFTPDDAGMQPSNSTYEGFKIPTNSTISSSHFSAEPKWVPANDNGTLWSSDSVYGFSNGIVNGTSYLTANGDLTLATNSTYGEMTDFETISPQLAHWSSEGDEFWRPVNLSAVSFGPVNSTSGNYAAGTNGSLLPGSSGYIMSEFWQLPAVIRYFNLSFDRWNSLDSGDTAEIQYSIDNGSNWQLLDNWTGNTTAWTQEIYPLDLLVQNASHIGFRFYVNKLNTSIVTEGLFIDSFNLSNQGDPLAAWFHGNSSGEYSPNADGTLIVPVDITGLTAPLELKYQANWDIQGGNYDNLVVMISQNNGSSWTIMSPLPGVPAHGIGVGGTTYNQHSWDWREIIHPFPHWAVGSPNASETLLKFRVTTDNSVNQGGAAIDDWEGIMIDDLTVFSGAGSQNATTVLLENFTDTSDHYLVNVSGYPNDWQFIDWEGFNGPWSTFDSFEEVQGLPAGWRIDHVRGSTSWERGIIDNSNGYGPNVSLWPSGSNGMGINLNGIYSNHVYTHLVSPNYQIPEDATARLTFNHWICTETDWDGGSIFTSIDNGITWQHFGNNIPGFYDRTSTVNPNSPFYQLGIFDGSTVPNGCGNANPSHTFSRVSGDISHLAGNDVRVRFSFFTDTYIEKDGWYIDDAGIVIDRFQDNGTWTSPLIDADFAGWARLTSLYEMPEETNVLVDVLDSSGNIIDDHSNLTLPFDLKVAVWEYEQIKFRVKMFTENETVTPRIKILHHGITEYLNQDILSRLDPNLPDWVLNPNSTSTVSGEYFYSLDLPNWRPYADVYVDCDGNVSAQISSITNRIPVLASATLPVGGQGTMMDEGECDNVLENSFSPAQATSIEVKIEPGETFNWIKIEPLTLLPPLSPSIDLGADGVIDWMWNGTFHYTNQIYSLEIDGINTPVTNPYGLDLNYSESLNFSIILPARNLSNQAWNCGIITQCYRGGLNFITNGTISPQLAEDYIWVENSGFSHYVTEYKFSFSASDLTNFKLLSLNYISGFSHTIAINTSLQELFTANNDLTSTMHVSISTQRGGIIFDGDIDHEKSIIDNWHSLPQQTFIPGLTQTAVSSHQNLPNTPELQSISLSISPSQNVSDSIASVTLDNLETGGRFIQDSGAGVIQLDSSNSSWDGENVTWSLTSKWMLDDYPRLYWFAKATNNAGISLGPVMGISGNAQYAASTNDLEIVDFQAWSDNRPLHDFSNPLWPLNVKGSNEITVTGEVRYSGLNKVHPPIDNAVVNIELLVADEVIGNVTTSFGENGLFNASIITPNDHELSGIEFKVIPRLTEIGSFSSETALDATSQSQNVRFVLDANNSEVISLFVDAPGGNQLADGHVWHLGQDIPLILELSDDNGLPNKMKMHYTRSGRTWESIEFLTPVGATEASIDLPFIDESNVPLPNEEVGWLDVYFEGFDLAGNPLVGGGNSAEPMARIHVQPRYSTWIAGESISLDRLDGFLLPGNTHRFNFTVSDDNGIESIDMMRIVLSKDLDICDIEWTPWSGEIKHDVGCFIKPPRAESVQRWQTNTWDVYIDFELRWDLEEDLGGTPNIPAMSLWDENAPLDVIFTSISLYNWSIHSGIDLRIDGVKDKIAPLGDFVDGIAFIHAQDIVDVEISAYHAGYQIHAHNLPFSTEYRIELIGNNATNFVTNSLNSDGTSTNRVVFDTSFYGTQVKLIAELFDVYNQTTTSDEIDFVIDDSSPSIVISGGHLVSVDSDKLENVQVQVTVSDDHGLNSDPIMMYWSFVRQGRIMDGSQGSASIPVEFQSVRSNLYSETINMNTSLDLQKGDSIMVWFEGSDASGRPIIGKGTTDVDPIETMIRWIAYEPELLEIVATPYRPQVGDIIYIDTIVENIGLVNGNSNLTITDNSGRVLEQINFTLLAGRTHKHTFEIEAWKEGDLGLRLQLDGQDVTLVPISSVQERNEDSSNSQATLLGLSFLSIFIAGILLFMANSRRNNHDYFDEEE